MAREREKKPVSVSYPKERRPINYFDYQLIKPTKDGLFIALANRKETSHAVEFVIDNAFGVTADSMLNFAMDLVLALQEYEKQYKDGKGLPPLADEVK